MKGVLILLIVVVVCECISASPLPNDYGKGVWEKYGDEDCKGHRSGDNCKCQDDCACKKGKCKGSRHKDCDSSSSSDSDSSSSSESCENSIVEAVVELFELPLEILNAITPNNPHKHSDHNKEEKGDKDKKHENEKSGKGLNTLAKIL